ncbi:MAG: hypothetical protein AB7T06_21210 [Kofleriaceae bacterium]
MTENARRDEVIRLLDRYLVEVVERYDLCPWARGARQRGEVAVEVLFGTPDIATWIGAAKHMLAQPKAMVAMVIAPELLVDRGFLHGIRNEVAAAIPSAGVAEFHPDAELDLASPARLVPFVRRSPDPMLQLVPLAILESVRASPPAVDRVQQARMLGGQAAPLRRDAADRIAAANHKTVGASVEALVATLADIAADRERSYGAAGIVVPTMALARASSQYG